MEKLDMQSPNGVEMNIDKIAALFPNCITEDRDDSGKVKRAIDFDLLRQELSADVVEGVRERYTLNWPGKNEAIATANAPINKTLRPCREESVDFDTTQNLYIEGDNLEALKLLQETYLGKVKMIFIDPPYNTGRDFIYSDNFTADKDEYELESGQKDEEGGRLVANLESNGRFHSDWLSMMLPRLRLARTLLSDDGVIFVSIDDNEIHNVRRLCDEVFGESNFIAHIIWQHSVQPKGYSQIFSVHHNHILCFRKSDAYMVQALARTEKDNKSYSNPDNDPRGKWRTGDVRNALYRPNLIYPLLTPSGKTIDPPENGWRWSRETMAEKIRTEEIKFSDDETRIIRKIFLADQEGRAPETIWFSDDVGNTRQGSKELKALFDDKAPFDTVKPIKLIDRMLQLAGVQAGDICMDFFAGSCSTAHSVLNSLIGCRFIAVQIPEPCDPGTPHGKIAISMGMRSIADIGKERIHRAGQKIKEENATTATDLDVGFRVLKVDSSNMNDVYYTPDQLNQDNIELFAEHIKSDRTAEDLLFQVMLDWGVPLSAKIDKQTIDGKTVYLVNENDLLTCFDQGINEALVKKLAGFKPMRAVFRDDAFESDSLKINVDQIFKVLSPGTDVKSI